MQDPPMLVPQVTAISLGLLVPAALTFLVRAYLIAH
jgi:hypothetical protein